MNVNIKDLSVSMDIKNKGVELEIKDTDGKHLGDLVVTKSKLIWCKGRRNRENGESISWKIFIDYMEGN